VKSTVSVQRSKEEAARRIQRWYREMWQTLKWGLLAAKLKEHKCTKKIRKKRETIKELFYTERTYVKHLENCVTHIVNPVVNGQVKFWKDPAQQKEVCEQVFRNIAEICGLSVEFLRKLEEREKQYPNNSKVGDLFLSVMEHLLKCYAIYVQGFHQSVEYLDTVTNKKWVEFLKQQSNELNKPLNSFLILPVQRLPRYEMLFEQLYDLTPEEHVDKADLRVAVKLVKEVNEDIDRQTQNRNKIIQIQKMIVGCPNLVKLDRYFIRQGEMQYVRKKKKKETCYLFLFNHLLVRTVPLEKQKKDGEKYEFLDMWDLPECELHDYTYDAERFKLRVATGKNTAEADFFTSGKDYWVIDLGAWVLKKRMVEI